MSRCTIFLKVFSPEIVYTTALYYILHPKAFSPGVQVSISIQLLVLVTFLATPYMVVSCTERERKPFPNHNPSPD